MMPGLFFFRWIEKFVEQFVFPRCDLVAGANEDNLQYALENGGRSSAATIFRYGNLIHQNHWQSPDSREGADSKLEEYGLTSKPFLATVARLEPVKRVADVIRVVAELNQRGHQIDVLIVGDGVLRGELERLATELNVEEAVKFAGERNQEWLASVLPRAVAIISPQMGRALAEAALAGVPIIAYDFSW